MEELFEFLKELRLNNNREWFNANKDRWHEVRAKADVLTSEMLALLADIDPGTRGLTPADCTYRIYRDTRFSNDKTPYKTHIGIFMAPGGKKSVKAGHYVHIEPENCLFAGGCWCPPAPLLKALREDIYNNVDEFLEIINAPEFRKLFPVVGENRLKTAPKGFPKDWEHIDLLKPRDYTVFSPLPDSFFLGKHKKSTAARLAEYFQTLQPFNDFLNFTIEENPSLATVTRR